MAVHIPEKGHTTCYEHLTKEVTFTCDSCDDIAICVVCAGTSHKGHNLTCIELKAEQESTFLKEYVSQLDKQINQEEKKLKETHELITSTENRLQNEIKEAENQADFLIKCIVGAKEKNVSILKSALSENKKNFLKYECEINQKMESSRAKKNLCLHTLNSDNKVLLVQVAKEMHKSPVMYPFLDFKLLSTPKFRRAVQDEKILNEFFGFIEETSDSYTERANDSDFQKAVFSLGKLLQEELNSQNGKEITHDTLKGKAKEISTSARPLRTDLKTVSKEPTSISISHKIVLLANKKSNKLTILQKSKLDIEHSFSENVLDIHLCHNKKHLFIVFSNRIVKYEFDSRNSNGFNSKIFKIKREISCFVPHCDLKDMNQMLVGDNIHKKVHFFSNSGELIKNLDVPCIPSKVAICRSNGMIALTGNQKPLYIYDNNFQLLHICEKGINDLGNATPLNIQDLLFGNYGQLYIANTSVENRYNGNVIVINAFTRQHIWSVPVHTYGNPCCFSFNQNGDLVVGIIGRKDIKKDNILLTYHFEYKYGV